MPRRGTAVAAGLAITALIVIAAVTYYRSWSRTQLAAGGWPPPQPLLLQSPPTPVTGPELARQLYAYLETPSGLCRRLTLLGGSCSSGPAGGVTGHAMLCLDEAYAPQSGQCLVYAFSVAGEWSFAEDAARRGCDVHVLDPTLSTPPDSQSAPGMTFHQIGLGAGTGQTESGAPTATLSEVKRKLGHGGRVIDYLKVDVQGREWDWLEGDVASLAAVRQLGMRLYLSLDSLARYHRLLRRVHDLGFRAVYSAADRASGRIWDVEGVTGKVAVVYDLVWINRSRCTHAFGCTG